MNLMATLSRMGDVKCPNCGVEIDLEHYDSEYNDSWTSAQATCPNCDQEFVVDRHYVYSTKLVAGRAL